MEPSPDPRTRRSRQAVVDAAVALLREVGVEAFTVESVVERSGVAKTTIYRHWPDRDALVLDALAQLIDPPSPIDTGSLAGDLTRLTEGLAQALQTGPLADLLPSVIAAARRDRRLAELHRRLIDSRHEAVRQVVRRGIARGELPPDTDPNLVVDLLGGPLFYRGLVAGRRLDRGFARQVVEVVLKGLQG